MSSEESNVRVLRVPTNNVSKPPVKEQEPSVSFPQQYLIMGQIWVKVINQDHYIPVSALKGLYKMPVLGKICVRTMDGASFDIELAKDRTSEVRELSLL